MKKRTTILASLVGLAAVAAVGSWLALHRPHDSQPLAFDPVECSAGLDRRIAQLRVNGAGLQGAIDEICKRTGVRIVVSPKLGALPRSIPMLASKFAAPAQMGMGMPVDLDFQDVTVAGVLDLLIDQSHGQFPKPIGYTATDDGSIVIAAEDELPRIVRAYDVRDVLVRLAQPARGARQNISFGNVQVGEPGRLSPEQQLLELAMVNRHAEFWIRPPGLRDPAWCAGGRLVVLETRRRHREIVRILQKISQIGPPWSPAS